MVAEIVKERLQNDINVWFADGIIDNDTRRVLGQRYEANQFGWAGVVKSLGIAGGLFAFFGILGLIAAASNSVGFTAILLATVGGGLTYAGLRLSQDIQERYTHSSRMLMTLGVVCWISAIALFAKFFGLGDDAILLATGCVALPISFFLAYYSQNTYLLILALLQAFHWIGAWNEMWGRSTYAFAVQDPRVMSLAAVVAIAIGMYHERCIYPRTGRFYLAWETLGLVYLNMSLLILSNSFMFRDNTLLWIGVFTAVCLTQIILGAAWHNSLIRGFGVTFFVINIFTRYHELFWDRLSLGTYLAVGGMCLVAVGICSEVLAHNLQARRGAA